MALPASLGGIVVGSVLAPVLVAGFGGPAALVLSGLAVLAYAALLLASRTRGLPHQPAPQREAAELLRTATVVTVD